MPAGDRSEIFCFFSSSATSLYSTAASAACASASACAAASFSSTAMSDKPAA